MFGFTRKTDYALVALACLAEEGPFQASGGLRSARRISEEHAVPLPVLMNVLKDLVGRGLVQSRRGAQGGYSLARPATEITVRDVVEAIEGPIKVTPCCGETEEVACLDCGLIEKCPVTRSVRVLNDRIHDLLRGVSLADLMRGNLPEVGTVNLATNQGEA